MSAAEMREAAAERAERRGFATLAAEIRALPLPDEEGMEAALAALRHYAEPCDAPPDGPCPYEENMCCKVARAALRAINGGKP